VETLMTSLLLLLAAAIAIQQDTLRWFLARREYPQAVSFYQARIKKDPSDIRSLRNLARVYDHWHRFDFSLFWWNQALMLRPLDDSAAIGRWHALFHQAEKDSLHLAQARQLIVREAEAFLAETTAQSLATALVGLTLGDTLRAPAVAALLAERFPDSPGGYEVIGTMFYDSLYPIWTNDTLKVPYLRRLLRRFPRTEWRTTIYSYLLSSLYSLNDTAQVRLTAAEMVQDDTLDPFRYRYAATILNRMKIDPDTALRYAKKALLLAKSAKKPANKPQEQWELEFPQLSALAAVAAAEALKAQGKYAEAKDYLAGANSYDADNDATDAPRWTVLGEVYEQEQDTLRARLAYVRALVEGDVRNQWAARADSGLKRLGYLTNANRINLGRGMLGCAVCFTDVTDSVGLAGRHEGRVAWGDYNQDGFEDLLLNGCRLFRNDSGRHFTAVTDSVGLAGAKGRGGVWADYDNDSWLDYYMCGLDTVDRLWHNDHGRFEDVTVKAGYPSDPYPTEGAAWADFDNDGWVDLYCANYENWEKHSYYPDRLYQNRHGVFQDVTQAAGIIPPYGIDLAGRGVNWGDYDNDGYQDCYVSNYRLCENLLWHNNHTATFTNRAGPLGVAGDEVNGWFGHTIGSAWADYDNDGDLDLFCANLAHPRYIEFSNRSMLYENLGPKARPRFIDRRFETGIKYEETHSDPAWADVDNDGDLDLYITSIYEGRRSFLYLNQSQSGRSQPQSKSGRPRAPLVPTGNRSFSDVTWLSGTRVFNGWGCAFADFDNDGDMDLVVGSGSGVRLFRNDTKNHNHWLKVRVIGTRHNAAGIGARIIVTQGKKRWLRAVEGGKGTTSQNSLIQHFGLGPSRAPVTVEVRFAPGARTVQTGIQPDRLLTITESQSGRPRTQSQSGRPRTPP